MRGRSGGQPFDAAHHQGILNMKMYPLIAVAALLAAGPAVGACIYPKAPANLPDGNTATKDEMLEGAKAVKAYDAEIKAYTDCLKLEHDESMAKEGANLTKEQREERERIQVQKHNAAVDELQAVAERFNEQIRAFNARQKKKS